MWCAQKGEKELDTGTQGDDNVLCLKFVPPLKPELKKTEVDDCSWSATQIDSKNAYGFSVEGLSVCHEAEEWEWKSERKTWW